MLRRFLFFALVASALGQRALASDGVLSIDLGGGHTGGHTGVTLMGALAYGDFNFDGVVDAADLPAWRSFFGMELLLAPFTSGGFTFDGRFDGGDFLTWQRNLGRNTISLPAPSPPSPPVTAIPEPASIIPWLLATASLGLMRRRPEA